MIGRIEAGWTVRGAAEAAGVSERTGYTWLARHRRGGERRLCARSSAPRPCPRRTSLQRVSEIERLRRQRMTDPMIARTLDLPRSTVGAVLRRLGLGKVEALEPKPPANRYERDAPGELIHIDIKSLGRIDRVGHRITGDRAGQSRSRGLGWDHLHVAIDDASRLAYTEILPGLTGDDASGFLERALAWYARLGVTVERVMTDNGSAYVSKHFATAVQAAGVRPIRTRPFRPRTNGKAERFIQTTLREWAYARPYISSDQRAAA